MKKIKFSYDQILFFIAFIGLAVLKNYTHWTNDLKAWAFETTLILFFVLFAIIIKSNVQLFVAHLAGDINVKIQRKYSFWPFRFIDPIGLVSAIFFQMGWGKAISSDKAFKGSKRLIRSIILLSGPLANIIIAVAFKFCVVPLESFSLLLAASVDLFARIQFQFGILNLFPIPPLDGWFVFQAAIKKNVKINEYRNYGLMLILILFYYDILQTLVFWITQSLIGIF